MCCCFDSDAKAEGRKFPVQDMTTIRDATRTALTMLLDTCEFLPHCQVEKEHTRPAAQSLVHAHITLVLLVQVGET